MSYNATPLLQMTGITKRFGPTTALGGVDLVLGAGEVVALMGANGAGKSTLVKIASGVMPQDGGTVAVSGQPVVFASPRAAQEAGIVTMHQASESGIVPTSSVAENLVLDELCGGRMPAFAGPRRIRARARQIAAALDLRLDLGGSAAALGPAGRQLVLMARAAAAKARVLILDEPTSSLSAPEAELLFSAIDRLRSGGVGILYISHRMGDLRRLAGRAVVLRNGLVAGDFQAPLDLEGAVRAMLGRMPVRPAFRARETGEIVLQIADVVLIPGARPFGLTLRAGETVAITGPVGAGKSRLLRAIFGDVRLHAGAMTLAGRSWRPRGPAASIAAGVHMAAADRWGSSLLPPATPGGDIAGTIALPHLARWFPLGPVSRARERAAAAAAIARLGIVCGGPGDTLDQLSGGNQQKVVLARWQAEPARLLLLDEPFQGVDVGARHDIAAAIRDGRSGAATLIATSDVEEAVEIGDRVLVMRDHGIVAEHQGAESAVMAAIDALEDDRDLAA